MDQYAQIIALVAPLFVIAIAVEFIVDRIRGTGYYRVNDAINSLSIGILSTYARVGLRLLMLVPYALVLEHLAPIRLPVDHWATWVLAFLLYDFMFYWLHRLSHEWNGLWAVHVVHHQSEEYNLTTALRQAALVPVVAWPFFIPLALVGIPWEVTGVVSILQLLYQFWPHTRHIGRLGVLDRWLQTPSNHRVHHAQNDLYLDRNYGGILMIWDRMFGTFQEEREEEPCIYGVRGQLKSWNPIWANWHVWQDIALSAWRTRSWRDKLRVWVAPPGWRPADVEQRWPKAPYTLDQFRRYDPPVAAALRTYALLQFAGCYLATAHYLDLINAGAGLAVAVGYAVVITVWLVLLGGLLEGRQLYLKLEAGRLLLTGGGIVAADGWFGLPASAAVVGAGVAYAGISLLLLAWAARAQGAAAAGPVAPAE